MIKRIISVIIAVSAVCCAAGSCTNKSVMNAGAEEKVLTYWSDLNGDIASFTDNQGNTEFAKELQKRTGVKIKFIHQPPNGEASNSFNLLIASKELPDIIAYPWYKYPGGAQKAIDDKCILQLNNVIEQYAPNLSEYLKKNPEIDKMLKTEEGSYYVFPFIRGDESLTVSSGPIVRADWLNQLGLAAPETIDEWYNMLKGFQALGAETPLAIGTDEMGIGTFSSAYGIGNGSVLRGGQVLFGPIMPEYKEFLITMKKWYNEGLIDKYFSSSYSQNIEYNIMNDKSGATIAYIGSRMGRWLKAMQQEGKGKELTAVKYPVLNKGDRQVFSAQDSLYTFNNCAAITTSCKDIESAAKLLDFGYGEEGHMLYNFGTEGVSYTMENGQPKYTDKIMKSESVTGELANYTQFFSGPYVQDVRYIQQYYTYPQQKEAVKLWLDNDNELYKLPIIYTSSEKQDAISRISTEVKKYVDEMLVKFIMGAEPIENFDEYVEYIKSLDIDKMLSYQQEAYNSYLSR